MGTTFKIGRGVILSNLAPRRLMYNPIQKHSTYTVSNNGAIPYASVASSIHSCVDNKAIGTMSIKNNNDASLEQVFELKPVGGYRFFEIDAVHLAPRRLMYNPIQKHSTYTVSNNGAIPYASVASSIHSCVDNKAIGTMSIKNNNDASLEQVFELKPVGGYRFFEIDAVHLAPNCSITITNSETSEGRR